MSNRPGESKSLLVSLTTILRNPPEAWAPGRQLAARAMRPVEAFLHTEAAGGIVLIVASVVALLWANSPWHESYQALWHTHFSIGLGGGVFDRDLHFWVNEGLMTLFFLVIGLEVKRELVEGTLATMQQAALPLTAAIGGMVVPAGIYAALNVGGEAMHGWGVPMATDIAFAVGIITLLGNRIPATVRVVLLALAIVDDIGAILVIAVFYSSGMDFTAVPIILTGLAIQLIYGRLGLRPGLKYGLPLVLIWAGLYKLGIHPTLAGVIVGMMTPVKPWYGHLGFLRVAREAITDFEHRAKEGGAGDEELIGPLRTISFAAREAVSPVVRLVSSSHGFVSFVIVPVFALANAGVNLGGLDLGNPAAVHIALGIFLGLVVGKLFGVLLFVWLGERLGLYKVPREIGYRGLALVGAVAGIGFTMAIFIAELAFKDPAQLGLAKTSVLGASATAAVIGLLLGRAMFKPPRKEAVGV